ncbi:lysophospholipid acyltransferase family protein [Marinobacterium weihaiense]|uniref:Lysophospholipid acyltransferase family protein n=1 Tax=Marinobacterium weihaiense TaxID=2851016 RepID=A0ABS6MBU5_9GAMM|nr:lysophospholipid acyltransferase family protein [Marinobacterium weihaiense]MBV0933777.1 lysophospholipid acyltransferase family protein [Marinobacterium weihaiense]
MKLIKSLLAVALLGLLALLPLSLSQRLGHRLGNRYWRKGDAAKMTRQTRRNVNACFPEWSESEREALARASLQQTGCSLCEMGMAWLWPAERTLKKVRQVHNEALLAEAIDAGKGVILIAPHLGNWEVLNLYLSAHYPFTAMYKPPQMKLMDDLIKRMRARLGTRMAPADTRGVRMVMKALRRGEMVGILPDQEPDRSGGIHVPFFGVQALTMKLLPQLAAQTGAVVVCGYAERLPDAQGFDLHFVAADEQINSRDLEAAAAAMNRSVETCVRALPEQYQWEYRRFSTRPEGAPRFYS